MQWKMRIKIFPFLNASSTCCAQHAVERVAGSRRVSAPRADRFTAVSWLLLPAPKGGLSSSLHTKGHKVASRQGTNRFLFVQACCFHCTPIRSASKGVLSMTIIMFRSASLVGGVRKTSVVLRFVSVVHELVSFTFTQQILGGPAASGIQYCWFVHHVAQRTRHQTHQSRKEERVRERRKRSRWEGNPNLRRRQPLSWNKCDCPCFL